MPARIMPRLHLPLPHPHNVCRRKNERDGLPAVKRRQPHFLDRQKPLVDDEEQV